MLVSALFDLFFQDAGQSKKPATIRFYRQRLKRFGEQFGDRELHDLKLGEINEYLINAGAGCSESTRRHNAVAVERIHKYALDNGLIEKPIFKRLPKPSVGRRDRLPTKEETAAILNAARPEFRLIFQALRQSGARPGELCRATIADCDFKKGVISLKDHKTAGKTKKPRLIPIGKKLRPMLDQAIGGRTEGPIFRGPSGKAWTVANLSATYRRLRDGAGLAKDLCLYLTRHEAGSRICGEKGIHAAGQVLGHSNISTTQRYVKTDIEDLKAYQDLGDDPAAELQQERPKEDPPASSAGDKAA